MTAVVGELPIVYVLDASSLIDFKKSVIPMAKQWEVFKELEAMVRNGRIAVCRQVINEVSNINHADVAGAWVLGIRDHCAHTIDVDEAWIQFVLSEEPDLVDYSKDADDADPWVVAQACQLRDAGYRVFVVTSDKTDRPQNVSIVTACERLEIMTLEPGEFLIREGLLGSTSRGGA